MAASGSKWFSRFIFLCLALGGFLFWNKHCRAKGGEEVKPETSGSNTEVEGSLKGIVTSDEACYLLHCDVNTRAEEMHKRNYPENENLKDKSLEYGFSVSANPYYYSGKFSFFNHQDYYFMTFSGQGENGKKGHDAFLSGFSGKEKTQAVDDCKGGIYKISDQCFICDIGFRREVKSYIVMIMRNKNLGNPQNRLPKPKVKKPANDDNDLFE